MISAEAKRLQVYQRTAEEVLRRVRHHTEEEGNDKAPLAGGNHE